MTSLTVNNAVLSYGSGRNRREVLSGVSLTLKRGEIAALVGESGCGKSSLARAVVGLHPLDEGSVEFEGIQVVPIARSRRPKELLPLQLVFQSASACLNPKRSIQSQIADGAAGQGRLGKQRVQELIASVGLGPELAGRKPNQLSGGQRQRAAIASALAVDPRVLILDEPFAALDASAQAQLANLLVALNRSLDTAMLVISHDLGIVRQVADVTHVMFEGRIVESAPTSELWQSPKHEYTKRLLSAIPRTELDGAEIRSESAI